MYPTVAAAVYVHAAMLLSASVITASQAAAVSSSDPTIVLHASVSLVTEGLVAVSTQVAGAAPVGSYPSSHCWQALVVELPSVLSEYRPDGQTSQAMPSTLYLPAAQLSQLLLSAFALVPAPHAMQTVCPGLAAMVPAGHGSGSLSQPEISTKVPVGAGSQVLLLGQSEAVHVDASLY